MPDPHSAHLSEEQLARIQDGDSPPALARHIEECAGCAARLRDLARGAAAYVEYRDLIRAPQLPAAPRPWPSLDTVIAGHEAAVRRPRLRWWIPALAAATLSAALVIVWLVRPDDPAPSRVNQLLSRAAMASVPRDRVISMRSRGHTLRRPAVLAAAVLTADPESARLQSLFASAHYGWQDPLGPRTFQSWRRAQPHPRDSVSLITTAGLSLYRVRTDVASGPLRAVALNLRAADLRPVAGDFEFAAEGLVAVEEVPPTLEPAPSPSLPATTRTPVESPVGPADTLRVLAALDTIDADAGDPLEVVPDAARRVVVVRAGALSPDRQQQVAAALAHVPRVQLDLDALPETPSPARRAPLETSSSSIPPGLRQYLEARLGGPVALQEATDRTLEISARALARAHALEVLSAGLPPPAASQLSPADQAILEKLRRRHIAEIERLAVQIRAALQPLLESSVAPPAPSPARDSPQSWQAGVPSLVTAARELDQLLNRLLAGSYSQPSGEEMLRSLPAALRRLEWAIQLQAKSA